MELKLGYSGMGCEYPKLHLTCCATGPPYFLFEITLLLSLSWSLPQVICWQPLAPPETSLPLSTVALESSETHMLL